MSSRTLVIGALGLVGKSFQKYLPEALGTHHFETKSLRKLDLLNPDLRDLVKDYPCSSAIIAAGIPNILRCEEEPQLTYQCNVRGPLQLVEQLCKMKITPILFSTDYVFDGKDGSYVEDSRVNPLNEYARQKTELEQRLSKEECLIIRLSKVYGVQKGDKTLIDEMVSALVNRNKVRAAYDQVFCPVLVDDVVKAVIELNKSGAKGIYHVCGNEAISRLDLAREVCRTLGVSTDLVEPISLKDLADPFIRPKRTDMINRKVCEKIGFQMNSLKSSIKLIVDQYEKCNGNK